MSTFEDRAEKVIGLITKNKELAKRCARELNRLNILQQVGRHDGVKLRPEWGVRPKGDPGREPWPLRSYVDALAARKDEDAQVCEREVSEWREVEYL